MIVINLATPGNSGVAFDLIKFSDTQQLIRLKEPKRVYLEDTVRIKSRMSWEDVQTIIQLVAILRELRVARIELEVPYFLGARSDRKFGEGGVNYMKKVICPIINSLKLDEVIVTDAHSLAVEVGLNNVTHNKVLRDLVFDIIYGEELKSFVVLSPDEGALKRTHEVADTIAVPVVACNKEREVGTGKILGVTISHVIPEGTNIVVVDDICDGGATFLALAKELEKVKPGNLYLAVAHGIFSKGFDELKKYYKAIATTNSVRDFTKEEREYVYVREVL